MLAGCTDCGRPREWRGGWSAVRASVSGGCFVSSLVSILCVFVSGGCLSYGAVSVAMGSMICICGGKFLESVMSVFWLSLVAVLVV